MNANIDGLLNDHHLSDEREDEENSAEEEESLDSLSKLLADTDDTSSPIAEKIALVVNQLYKQALPLDKMKGKMADYNRPDNCSTMVVKKCNKELWNDQLHAKHRATDIRHIKIQNNALKGGIALAQVADQLLKLRHENSLSTHATCENVYRWVNIFSRS